MSEYEIFNDEEEVVPEEPKKEKKVKEKKEKADNIFFQFLKKAFCLENLSLSLGIISLFLSLFTGFIPLAAAATLASIKAASAFFFMAFSCALAGIVLESIKMVKQRKFILGIHIIVVILAFIVSVCVIPY